MKTSQWIAALVALMVVVFLVTFFTNFVGKSSSVDEDVSATEDLPTLTFFERTYPYRGAFDNGEQEHRRPGHQDYWFVNNNDEPVRVGAVSKSCKCQGVEVYVLPEGYRPRHAGWAEAIGAATGSCALTGLVQTSAK